MSRAGRGALKSKDKTKTPHSRTVYRYPVDTE